MSAKRKRHTYTDEQADYLKQHVHSRHYGELAEMFNERFGTSVSKYGIEQFCRARGWLNGMNNNRFTAEQVRFLRDNATGRHYGELTRMFNERFGTSARYINISRACAYHGFSNGRKGGYEQGHTMNVGRRLDNYMPVGSEIVKSNGYTIVKQPDDSWKFKQIAVWEATHGPVPEGHYIIFGDGDRSNFDLSNLHCVTSSEAGVWSMRKLQSDVPEIAEAGVALARLYSAINKRDKSYIPRSGVKKG